MKKSLFYFLVTLSFFQASSGVTILRVEGTFETVIEGNWPLVGEDFEFEIPYELTDPVSQDTPNSSSFILFNQPILRYGGDEFFLDLTVGDLSLNGETGVSIISFSPQSNLGGPSGHFLGLTFQSNGPFWDDPGSLPASLDE